MQNRWVLMKKKLLGKSGNGGFPFPPSPPADQKPNNELSITNTKSTKTVIEMRYAAGGSGSSVTTASPAAVEVVTTEISGASSIPVAAAESSEFTTNTDFANDFDQEECYEWVSCKLVSVTKAQGRGFDP